MLTLKEAYESVMQDHKDGYVHVCNEFANEFEFLILPNGSTIGDFRNSFLMGTVVNKSTGKIYEAYTDECYIPDGEYRQYTKQDLEELLQNSSDF